MTSSSWQTASARTISDYIGECRGFPGSRTRLDDRMRLAASRRGVARRPAGRGAAASVAVDLVRLPVVVTTATVSPCCGLDRRRFRGLEEGDVRQNIVTFAEAVSDDRAALARPDARQEPQHGARPRGGVDRGRQVRQRLLEKRVDVTFVEFDAHRPVEPLPAARLPAALRADPRPQDRLGHTALYDALGRYIESTRDRDRHARARALHRRRRLDERPRRLPRSSICCGAGNVIALRDRLHWPIRQARRGSFSRAILHRFARETGGDAFFPGSPAISIGSTGRFVPRCKAATRSATSRA